MGSTIVLLLFYNATSIYYFIGGIYLLQQESFQYQSENSLVIVVFGFIVATWAIAIAARRSNSLQLLVIGLLLAQMCTVLAIGYHHGKTIFNGAIEVHFLDNSDVCDTKGNAQWVFLGHFSNSSIFMDAKDKRLCFTDAKNYRLVSRKILENL